MNAQNLISHRMFVAALSHDEYQPLHKAGNGATSSAPANAGPRARHTVAPVPPTVAEQLYLLAEVAELQPTQA